MFKPAKTQFYLIVLVVIWTCSMIINWINSTSRPPPQLPDAVIKEQLQTFLNQIEKRQEQQMEFFFDSLSKRLTNLIPDQDVLMREWKEKQIQEFDRFVTDKLNKFEESHREQDRKLLNSLLEYSPGKSAPGPGPVSRIVSNPLTRGPNDRNFGIPAPGAMDEVCWSGEERGVFIPEFANDESPKWTNLHEAKVFCEFYYSDCSGITRSTLPSGAFVFEARGLFIFRPSDANESSWIKTKCNGNETDDNISALKTSLITGILNTSVPKGFYEPPFNCSDSSARSARQSATKIRRIWVWGERNSGTGLTQSLLEQNFNLTEKVIGGLPWKHGWMHQQDLSRMQSTLNILLVKDAYSWLASMHKSPIHAPDHADLPLEVFLLREWYAEKDIGEIDKHPVLGTRLANIFQVRAAKLMDWNAVAPCLPYTYVLRYEDLITNITSTILDIAERYADHGLVMKRPGKVNTSVCVISFGGCANKKEKNQTKIAMESEAKRQYYIKHQYLNVFEKKAAELVLRNLDMDLETQFGYNYSYVPEFVEHREHVRAQAGMTPEKLQMEKRKLPKPKKKARKNRKKWKGV